MKRNLTGRQAKRLDKWDLFDSEIEHPNILDVHTIINHSVLLYSSCIKRLKYYKVSLDFLVAWIYMEQHLASNNFEIKTSSSKNNWAPVLKKGARKGAKSSLIAEEDSFLCYQESLTLFTP